MTALPLPLAHTLEEEYVRLYGTHTPLERRWRVRPEEILDAHELARKLTQRFGTNSPRHIGNWLRGSSHDPEYRDAVAAEVNEILETASAEGWLFETSAFKDAKKVPYSKLEKASGFDSDAVFNLNRQMFDELFAGDVRSSADVRFAEIIKRIHERAKPENGGVLRTALTISGGGIRSATFALGVLQGLARKHVLEKFDFVSTVSGGGYIGSWLSSWVRRDPWGIRGVSALLSSTPRDTLTPEPAPIRHLRAYSNYLTPRLGILSADTWSLVATYIRNLLLNWIVLIPLLAGILAVPRYVVTAVVREPEGSTRFASQGAVAGGIVGVLFLIFALGALVYFRPVTDSKRTKTFTDMKFVGWVLVPFLISAIALVLAWAWHVTGKGPLVGIGWFLGFSTLATLSAFLVFVWQFRTAAFIERRVDIDKSTRSTRLLWELGGSIGAGLLGGLLMWLFTTKMFPTPVEAVERVPVVRWPVIDTGGLEAVTASYVCFGVPLLLVIFFLQAVVFVGASSHQNHDFDREWWARASGWVLLAALGWIAISGIAIYGPVAIYHVPRMLSALGGAAGVFSLLAGRSSKTDAGGAKKGEESVATKATNFALGLAVPIFVIYVLALISLGITWALRFTKDDFAKLGGAQIGYETRLAERATREYDTVVANETAKIKEVPLANAARVRSYEHLRILQDVDKYLMLAIALGCPILALIVSRCIGVNVFSMHAMYRNRLVRAYLGASRFTRDPNTFTGFDPRDNLSMHDLRPEYLWWHSFRDLDNAAAQLERPSKSRLIFLAQELRKDIGDELDRIIQRSMAEEVRQPGFYQALNHLIASRDLPTLFDPKIDPAPEVFRPLRNRRFIEEAFGDTEVYPSPMPLLCVQDVLDLAGLKSALKVGSIADVNDIIAKETLKDVPPFDALKIDAAKFVYSDIDPVHRMIDNRLRLDAAMPGILTPLDLARPLHVVNICLNLTSGEELGWQERKGESFTVSPLSSGNYRLGYRDTRRYGSISVGTAVTISGAAASPNMGYHSSPALAFLMTLFNVRLGWWLGNPGVAGNKTYQRRNPRSSIIPFIFEATGNSNDRYAYVYLSDGGHFENLGMYEMVLRRTHRLVVSDAGADPKYVYDDLGNAVRKIRIDFGIPIDITHMGILPPTKDQPGKYCAIGTINYQAVDGPDAVNGKLLYIKPVVYQDEGPRDVLNYAKNAIDFPHESTADQWFSESQFESYRRLGLFAIEQIASEGRVKSVDDLIDVAEKYIKPVTPEIV